jgi:hypothetical protein
MIIHSFSAASGIAPAGKMWYDDDKKQEAGG